MKRAMAFAMAAAAAWSLAAAAWGRSASLRLDTRGEGWIATGVEVLGSTGGESARTWDTTGLPDGWTTVQSGGVSKRVLVLNGPAVEGGRLAADAVWSPDRVHVVRHDVVVGAGRTLTVEAGTVVKFAGGAKIVREVGGTVVMDGALLADFADDSVGGDTNLDGEDSAACSEWADWVGGVPGLVEVRILGGAGEGAQVRTYSEGRALGALPVPEREGALFGGWVTAGGLAVGAGTAAGADTAALYAVWEAAGVEAVPGAVETGAAACNVEVAVTATGGWTAEAGEEWLTVTAGASGTGNGTVRIAVAANGTAAARTGVVRIRLDGGNGEREVAVTQAGMAVAATPTVSPGDGTTFQGNARRVVVSCATDGATVRYTLDGTDPDESSTVVPSGGFNVFDTTVVKARAWADGMLPSGVAVARIVRLPSLAEALDVPLWSVVSDGDAAWVADSETGRTGGSSARSGSIGENQRSVLSTGVSGSGRLSFLWKASCEDDPDDTGLWDGLAFSVDGTVMARLDGETDWAEAAFELGSGTHSLEWSYAKDDLGSAGEDCGWVDAVSWTPTVALDGMAAIPVSWFENQGLVALGGTAEDAAAADPDGDGMTTAQEYLAGTDPNDPGSVFAVRLAIDGGNPVVDWAPELGGGRTYRLWAKRSLDEERWTDVTGVADLSGAGWRFFAVSVE